MRARRQQPAAGKAPISLVPSGDEHAEHLFDDLEKSRGSEEEESSSSSQESASSSEEKGRRQEKSRDLKSSSTSSSSEEEQEEESDEEEAEEAMASRDEGEEPVMYPVTIESPAPLGTSRQLQERLKQSREQLALLQARVKCAKAAAVNADAAAEAAKRHALTVRRRLERCETELADTEEVVNNLRRLVRLEKRKEKERAKKRAEVRERKAAPRMRRRRK